MKRGVFFIGVTVVLFFCYASISRAQTADGPPLETPGRPVIQNNSVYTAWGTPLRGAHADIGWDDDNYHYMRTVQLLDACLENGLNAVHVYVESLEHNGEPNPLGCRAAQCDVIVGEAAKRGLYVVIKMGEMSDQYIEEDSQFMYDFWEFYAQRYKDQEHVIFEICNECPAPPENVLKAYDIIREYAPNTMVIFYSFSNCLDAEYELLPILRELDDLAGGRLTWENEAVGFHAYESTNDPYSLGADWAVYTIDALINAGYPIINTEMPNYYALCQYPNIELYSIMEERGLAWLGFTTSNMILQIPRWRGRFEAYGLTWQPDYGAWPVVDAIYPFAVTGAVDNISHATAEPVIDEGGAALAFSGSGYVSYNRLNFGSREPLSLRVSLKSAGGGRLSVRQGGPGGQELANCEIPPSAAYVTVSADIYNAINGISDVTLVFSLNSGGITLLRDWRFMLPAQASYTDPLKLTYAANYPYRFGNIVRRPCTDSGSVAAWQVEGITNDSYVLYDFVRFREKNVIIPFHIRAQPLAGGSMEIWAGDFINESFFLGELEINGPTGRWAVYSCNLEFGEWFSMWNGDNTRTDLKLVFKGEEGKELFAISEFYLGQTKPGPGGTYDAVVKTGNAINITMNSAVVADNELRDFDEEEIVEMGVMYSLSHHIIMFPEDMYISLAAGKQSPFAVTIENLEQHPDIPFYKYRAYVKTAGEIYYGGTKRFTLAEFAAKFRVLYQTSPIPAQVKLYGGGKLICSTATEADGSCTLSATAGAGYTLVITKPGYLSYTVTNLSLTAAEDIEALETVDLRQMAGDIDGNGVVNATDLTYLLSEFNRDPVIYKYADIDSNGVVNATDLTYLLAGFNKHNVVEERFASNNID